MNDQIWWLAWTLAVFAATFGPYDYRCIILLLVSCMIVVVGRIKNVNRGTADKRRKEVGSIS